MGSAWARRVRWRLLRHPYPFWGRETTMKRLLEILQRPMTIGVTVGVALFVFFVSIQGPARCRVGWPFPSIGRQGACSHHGGVSSSPRLFELILSIFAGWAAGALRNRPLERRRLAEHRAADSDEAGQAFQ
jgi:hypothetical protein